MPEAVPAAGLAMGAALYAVGLRRLWAQAGRDRIVHRRHAVAYGAGLAAVAAALVGPVDTLSHRHLWAHMTQHVLLIAVAAPLLVLGSPLPTLLWALPESARGRAWPWWREVSRSRHGARWAAWASIALVVHAVVMWTWHAPVLYQAALRHDALHGLEHMSYLLTAVVLWWALLGARPRGSLGLGVLAVFVAALQSSALGAFMTLAGHPWYPAYAHPGGGGLSAMEDQQVAGVIMWGLAGLVYVVAGVAVFATWVGRAERLRPGRGPVQETVAEGVT